MTLPDKKLRFVGVKVTREHALEGLGDPSTWPEASAAFDADFVRGYEDSSPASAGRSRADRKRQHPRETPVRSTSSSDELLAALVRPEVLAVGLRKAPVAPLRQSAGPLATKKGSPSKAAKRKKK